MPAPAPADPLAELARQHVAEQQAIPIEELQVAGSETLHFPMLGRTYQHVVVVHSQAGATQVYTALVDPATSEVETDVEAVRKEEAAAYAAKYGKLEPALYERMQRGTADERLPVGVWLSFGAAEFQPEAIAAEVAKEFPEAAAALAQRGAPWAVDDSELAEEILQAYSQLLQEAADSQTEPLVAWLQEKGYEVEKMGSMPIVAVTLPKALILELADHPLVEAIYLLEGESAPASD